METSRLKLVPVLIVLSALTIAATAVAQTAEVKTWQEHMQSLSNTLVDAFPYLYSAREYKLPANKKMIVDSLTKLATTIHTLPLKSGEALIGAEPLVDGAPLSIKDQANEAIRLYNEHDFESSQKKVFGAVQRCFACHAAHQVGPQFPTTNSEVMGLATSNVIGKAMVFGALRQFDGVLQLIDRDGKKSINKKSPAADSLVKLYLLVSLRSQQDFAKGLAFIDRVDKMSGGSLTLRKWKKDIESWKTLTSQNEPTKIASFIAQRKQADESSRDDSLFVVHLFETYVLHKSPLPKSATADAKATTFRQLAESYSAMDFTPFVDLPGIYYRACAKAAPESASGKQCQAKLQIN